MISNTVVRLATPSNTSSGVPLLRSKISRVAKTTMCSLTAIPTKIWWIKSMVLTTKGTRRHTERITRVAQILACSRECTPKRQRMHQGKRQLLVRLAQRISIFIGTIRNRYRGVNRRYLRKWNRIWPISMAKHRLWNGLRCQHWIMTNRFDRKHRYPSSLNLRVLQIRKKFIELGNQGHELQSKTKMPLMTQIRSKISSQLPRPRTLKVLQL